MCVITTCPRPNLPNPLLKSCPIAEEWYSNPGISHFAKAIDKKFEINPHVCVEVIFKILSKVDCLPLLNSLANWSHMINLLQSFPPGSVVRWNKDMMRIFWVILLAPLLNRFHLCWILFQMKRPTYVWSWWCIKT